MTISTHILDTSSGKPADRIDVTLEMRTQSGEWKPVGFGSTDSDGRISRLLEDETAASSAAYRITFETGAYFEKMGKKSFHPRVQIEFQIHDPDDHYHVPLLLSPFGYTTYRGS